MIVGAATDWTGIAAVVSALFGGIAAVIAAYFAARANMKVSTPAGTPQLGELGANVAAAVSTPPHVPPLGQLASDAVGTIAKLTDMVNGQTQTPETKP